MDIQIEVQKIHHQFGVSEKANYEIQKLFDKLILEDRAEQLRISAFVGRSELLNAFLDYSDKIYWTDNDVTDRRQVIEQFLKSIQ